MSHLQNIALIIHQGCFKALKGSLEKWYSVNATERVQSARNYLFNLKTGTAPIISFFSQSSTQTVEQLFTQAPLRAIGAR